MDLLLLSKGKISYFIDSIMLHQNIFIFYFRNYVMSQILIMVRILSSTENRKHWNGFIIIIISHFNCFLNLVKVPTLFMKSYAMSQTILRFRILSLTQNRNH